MDQKEFISLLQKRCRDLGTTISENMVWNMNSGVSAPEFIEKSSSQWKNFVNDVDTYFSLYEDDNLKAKAQSLLNCPTINADWVEEMDAFLHGMSNQLLRKEAKKTNKIASPVQPNKRNAGNKVFIVHGHDDVAKLDVAHTLLNLQITPVILHEQASGGKTIIEKIEEYTDVDFAVVLYTPCDFGRSKEEPKNQEKPRARQNVVFEHGYLIGKLGRDHVCALVKEDTVTPGDISGVVYIKMDEAGAWKLGLGKEMKKAGLNIDLNNLI